jgi:hypothetical protein
MRQRTGVEVKRRLVDEKRNLFVIFFLLTRDVDGLRSFVVLKQELLFFKNETKLAKCTPVFLYAPSYPSVQYCYYCKVVNVYVADALKRTHVVVVSPAAPARC